MDINRLLTWSLQQIAMLCLKKTNMRSISLKFDQFSACFERCKFANDDHIIVKRVILLFKPNGSFFNSNLKNGSVYLLWTIFSSFWKNWKEYIPKQVQYMHCKGNTYRTKTLERSDCCSSLKRKTTFNSSSYFRIHHFTMIYILFKNIKFLEFTKYTLKIKKYTSCPKKAAIKYLKILKWPKADGWIWATVVIKSGVENHKKAHKSVGSFLLVNRLLDPIGCVHLRKSPQFNWRSSKSEWSSAHLMK